MSEVIIKIADQPVTSGRMVKVVTIIGVLDESNADEKADIIYDMIASLQQGAVVIFDLKDLNFMNSKSVGYLTDWYLKIVDEKGGALVLTQTKSGLLDILDTVGLLQIIRNYSTMDEAIKFASS